jgi:hypothetical protein
MGLNNWSVASKVRKGITFYNFPVISQYIDVKFRFSEVGILFVGIDGGSWIFSMFPSDQLPEAVIATILIFMMTIYLLWRPSSNPEKNNLQLLTANTFSKRKRHYKKLTQDDLEGYK